jgi:hypothetical protein
MGSLHQLQPLAVGPFKYTKKTDASSTKNSVFRELNGISLFEVPLHVTDFLP